MLQRSSSPTRVSQSLSRLLKTVGRNQTIQAVGQLDMIRGVRLHAGCAHCTMTVSRQKEKGDGERGKREGMERENRKMRERVKTVRAREVSSHCHETIN